MGRLARPAPAGRGSGGAGRAYSEPTAPPADSPMSRSDVYHSHPQVLGGTPVFAGTRVPVSSLIDHLKAGDPLDRFLDGFPSVSREQAEQFLALALAEALDATPREEPA